MSTLSSSSEDEGGVEGVKRKLISGNMNRTDDDSETPRAKKPKVVLGGNTYKGFISSTQSLSDSTDGEETTENPAKNFATQSLADQFVSKVGEKKGIYNDVAAKIMSNMGYTPGMGLGKEGQGRKNIVEASTQKGRRGLGHVVSGFQPDNLEWNFEKEDIILEESVEWLPMCQNDPPDMLTLKSWIVIGPKKMTIDDENEYCSQQILDQVLKCKSVFDNLESEEMRRARTRSNPYETIRGAFFLNRAAMKMANMDSLLDFMFTEPKDSHGRSLVDPEELLYFCDVCAGPGGFSEYVLWRKNYNAKGFGFTLKGPCDFKLEDFFAAPSELFEPHYGVGGQDGDGDIYRPDNLLTFQKFVHQNTANKGVHFVTADGGFSVEGQENIQEILSKRLYLCQFLCALMVLRPGGSFVCKLFDLFTPFSVGLVYLMYRAFKHVCIIKPVTSRPANSERYIVCKYKREDSQNIQDYMFELNVQFSQFSNYENHDICEVVSAEVIKQDDVFFNYIYKLNDEFGKNQCIALIKIQTFAKNSDLYETRQVETRENCLKLWKIPDQTRKKPNVHNPEKHFNEILNREESSNLLMDPEQLLKHSFQKLIRSVYDFRCFIAGNQQQCLLYGMGRTNVFKWNGRKWLKVQESNLELPRETLITGEFVQELRGEGRAQRKVTALHITDVVMLCGRNVRDLHLSARLLELKKFLKAINRPTLTSLMPIRAKEYYRCEELATVFERLSVIQMKGGGNPRCQAFEMQEGQFYLPAGVSFIKTVAHPWMMAWSKSQNKKYYFNTMTRDSVFETRPDTISSSCNAAKIFWPWNDGTQSNNNTDRLSKEELLKFLGKMMC